MDKQFTLDQQLAISLKTEHSLIKSVLYIGYFIIFISVIVLIGWYSGIAILKSVFVDYISMKVNTAVAFILLAFCFILNALFRLKIISETSARLITPLALFVGLFGILSSFEYFFDINLGIDQFLFKDTDAMPGTISGRMALSAALSFTFIGFTLAFQGSKERTPTVAQACFLFVLLIGYGGLLGYLFGAPQLSGFGKLNAMAIHTTVLFILVELSELALFHDHRLIAIVLSPTPAGFASRRLIPIIVFAPYFWGGCGGHSSKLNGSRGLSPRQFSLHFSWPSLVMLPTISLGKFMSSTVCSRRLFSRYPSRSKFWSGENVL
jgi:hypothetical protein